EQHDIRGEEVIGYRDEAAARQLLDQIREWDVQQQHPDKRAGKQPLQIVDAAGDACLVADRPHDVVGGQYREDVEPAPAEHREFDRIDLDKTAQYTLDALGHSGPRAGDAAATAA